MRTKFPLVRTTLIAALLCTADMPLPRAQAQQREILHTTIPELRAKAEHGDADAQYNLGALYRAGEDVPQDLREAVKLYRKAAAQNDAEAQCNLARCYARGRGVTKDEAEAMKLFLQVAEAGDEHVFNSLAWMLATSENAAIRDGAKAVQFAEKAVAATSRENPSCLDTLAAAYAEAGQFEKAVTTQKEAMALLKTEKEEADSQSRLNLYENKRPYRAND